MQARPFPQQLTARITSCKTLMALGVLLQEFWGQLDWMASTQPQHS
jgi:hypothetical protein